MFFPVNLIFGWLIDRGMKDKTAGPVAWLITIVIAIVLAVGAYETWKAVVVNDADKERRLEAAEKTLEQVEEAEGVDGQLEDRDDAVIDDLEEGARNAAQNDPEGTANSSGPATTSVHDGLRDSRRDAR